MRVSYREKSGMCVCSHESVKQDIQVIVYVLYVCVCCQDGPVFVILNSHKAWRRSCSESPIFASLYVRREKRNEMPRRGLPWLPVSQPTRGLM